MNEESEETPVILTSTPMADWLGVARPRAAERETFRPESSLDAPIPASFGSGGTVDQLRAIVRRTDRSMSDRRLAATGATRTQDLAPLARSWALHDHSKSTQH